MFDHSRLVRLITVALASCAVTWALAAGAFARPDAGATTTEQSSAPAFKFAAGDTNKAPSATTQAPAFQPTAGDTAKTPDPAQVQAVLNGIDNKTPAPAVDTTDDTGTIALILAIAAILAALGAVTLTITRTHRPVAGA
jgi:hypothetical protein